MVGLRALSKGFATNATAALKSLMKCQFQFSSDSFLPFCHFQCVFIHFPIVKPRQTRLPLAPPTLITPHSSHPLCCMGPGLDLDAKQPLTLQLEDGENICGKRRITDTFSHNCRLFSPSFCRKFGSSNDEPTTPFGCRPPLPRF